MNNLIQNNRQLSFNKNNYTYSHPSSKTKKLATGFTSAIIPGLGQVINGDTAKGLAFWLASLCNFLLFLKNKKTFTLGSIGRIGIGVWAAKDAYDKA